MRGALVAAAALVVGMLLLAGGASGAGEPSGAAGWESLLGDRPTAQLGNRWIVMLDKPSLASRVAAHGGVATEEQERGWTRQAHHDQEDVLARLAFHGVPIDPEHSFTRIFNGFAAPLDGTALAAVQRDPDVTGVFPVRTVLPAAVSHERVDTILGTDGGRRPDVGIPGYDGAGVTVALLDTGVDFVHPYISRALLPGIDVLDPTGDASARQNPTVPGRPERHGTEMAGLVAGSGGPAGLEGVAPGASILPIRIAGWQPDASGGVSVYGRTDQLLAGMELAVDPNADGDAHDAARVTLVGVVEPLAGFSDGPLAAAAAGARALDSLVVVPAGNDGPAGPAYGSIGGPGGAPGALTVGAVDTRERSPAGHVLLLAGLRTIVSGVQPLGGVVDASVDVSAPVVALAGSGRAIVGAAGGLTRLFDASGYSRVGGAAVLLPRGTSSPEAISEAVTAGARAVLIDGPLPAGSLGVEGPADVPVLGLASEDATVVRTALVGGVPVTLAVGAASFGPNEGEGAIAPFSSEGLSFGGGLKPEVTAAGVGLATSDPGRDQDGAARYGTLSGTSAAAAVAAGAAALLAQARPDLDAAELGQALVAASRRQAGSASGQVDPAGAASVELVSSPAAVAMGSAFVEGKTLRRRIVLRNVSRRRLDVTIEPGTADAADITVATTPTAARIGPGAAVPVIVSTTVPLLPRAPASLGGILRVRIAGGGILRVPWEVAVPLPKPRLITGVRLSSRSFKPSDLDPAVLSIVAGRVEGTADRPQILPLRALTIDLFRTTEANSGTTTGSAATTGPAAASNEHEVGTMVSLRDLLPGRYAFGITGRGPRGKRLPPGTYSLHVTAVPVGGAVADERSVPFEITP